MFKRALILVCAPLFAITVYSQTITVAGGQTIRAENSEHDSYRLEINFNWKPELWSDDRLTLSFHHAFSAITFRDENTINSISWAPNLILTPNRKVGIYPYLQLGFGFAYLSDDKFKSKGYKLWDGHKTSDMGSHGQFESSLAVGLQKNHFAMRAKIYHYSNAQITNSNGGMDVLEFGIGYSL